MRLAEAMQSGTPLVELVDAGWLQARLKFASARTAATQHGVTNPKDSMQPRQARTWAVAPTRNRSGKMAGCWHVDETPELPLCYDRRFPQRAPVFCSMQAVTTISARFATSIMLRAGLRQYGRGCVQNFSQSLLVTVSDLQGFRQSRCSHDLCQPQRSHLAATGTRRDATGLELGSPWPWP